MPVYNFFHWSEEHGLTLTETGPLVAVEVSIPPALKKFLLDKGQPIPPPQTGYALVDTGAFATAVDESVFTALGVQFIDTMPTNTPHGPGTSHVYPATISFPGLEVDELAMERVIGCNLKWQTRQGQEIIMLLGRDLLRHFLMVYNGPGSDVTICR